METISVIILVFEEHCLLHQKKIISVKLRFFHSTLDIDRSCFSRGERGKKYLLICTLNWVSGVSVYCTFKYPVIAIGCS